jgi:RNA polymerase sigma-70 factor, ECF subfamily
MNDSECPPLPVRAETPDVDRTDRDVKVRVRAVVDRYYDFVWRTLQYVGMSESNADDGAQQVMCVLARRIREIEPGAERPFLFSTCIRVAAESRRNARRRPTGSDAVDLDALVAETPALDDLLDQQRARQLLAKVLETMPEGLRVVFMLFEIEELAMPDIAGTLGIPVGTVASRLRRARQTFHAAVARVQAASRDRGGPR